MHREKRFVYLLAGFLFWTGFGVEAQARSCVAKPKPASHILFLSDRPGGKRNGNWDLYRARIDGSNVERITDFEKYSIRWFDIHKPSGLIVLAGSRKGNLSVGPSGKDGGPADAEEAIAIRKPDGNVSILIDVLDQALNPQKFTTLWHPTLSPDGRYIVFAAARVGESNNLWAIRIDGKELTQILPDKHRTQNDPRFTPDGRVVYVRHNQTGLGQLLDVAGFDTWVINPRKPRVTNKRLTVEKAIPGPPLLEHDPAMSPDCQWVATTRSRLIPPTNALSIMRSDGRSSGFADTLTSQHTGGLLGVATWIDNNHLLSYAWNNDQGGWRIIRFNRTRPGQFSYIPLGTPQGSRDVMPLAY